MIRLRPLVGNPWSAAGIVLGGLVASCLAAILAFRNVPRRPVPASTSFGWQALIGHGQLLSALRKDRSLWRTALGDSVFYFVGGIVMLTLAQSGREMFPDGVGAARQTGLMLALLGGGVALGSVLAARLSRRAINLGLVPFGALAMSAVFSILALLVPGSLLFLASLAALGVAGGIYLVPLATFLVDRSKESERGRVLAASSMLSSIAGVLAVGAYRLTTAVFHLSTAQQFLLLATLMLATAVLAMRLLPQDTLRVVGLFLARLRYSVRTVGVEHLPKTGGALIVCNHVSYVDTIILSLASPRPVRFLSHESFFKTPVLGSILRVFGAIPIAPGSCERRLAPRFRLHSGGRTRLHLPRGSTDSHRLSDGTQERLRNYRSPCSVPGHRSSSRWALGLYLLVRWRTLLHQAAERSASHSDRFLCRSPQRGSRHDGPGARDFANPR